MSQARIAYTAFVGFVAAVATLVAVAFLSGPPEAASASAGEEGPRQITLEELARHDSEESCWKAIRGKVYDFTEYLPMHPSPKAMFVDWCGREATEGWDTKGYGRPHTPAAEAMLPPYLIGVLVE